MVAVVVVVEVEVEVEVEVGVVVVVEVVVEVEVGVVVVVVVVVVVGGEMTSHEKRFENHLEKFKEWTLGTLKKNAAADMQKAIRAEAGATAEPTGCVVLGSYELRESPIGSAVCVTCGIEKPWKGSKWLGMDGLDAGHYLGGRGSILFEERGIHPQCTSCNRFGGSPESYHVYMLNRYGQDVIDELQRRKNNVKLLQIIHGKEIVVPIEPLKWLREELVAMRIRYLDRTKAAWDIIRRET